MMDEKVTLSMELATRLKDLVGGLLRRVSDVASDDPRFDYCCEFCGKHSSEPHTITHKPDCKGLALQRELQEVLGG